MFVNPNSVPKVLDNSMWSTAETSIESIIITKNDTKAASTFYIIVYGTSTATYTLLVTPEVSSVAHIQMNVPVTGLIEPE
jgi:hypothetical protein